MTDTDVRQTQARVDEATRHARLARIEAAADLRARGRRRSRIFRWMLGCLALIAAFAVITLVVLAVVDARQDRRARTDDDVLTSARAAVTTMLTSSPADAQRYPDRVLAVTTGDQHRKLERSRDALIAAVAAEPAATTGQVMSAGLIADPTGDGEGAHARVLLVAQASDPQLVGGDPAANRITLSLEMTRTGGAWKIAEVNGL
ncbi:hypothetical protein [Gordonia sp. NPDC003429]